MIDISWHFRLDAMIQECNKLQTELNHMPAGKLLYRQKGSIPLYSIALHEDGRYKRKGITQNKELIALFARKAYLELLVKRLEKKIKWVKTAAPGVFDGDWIICLDELTSCFPKLQREVFLTGKPTTELTQSMNPVKSETNIHITPKGIKVKSKSELSIATALEQYHIPYEYEKALAIDGAVLYPDFTILLPRDEKLFYWEHFGMTHVPEYLDRMDRKLHTYRAYGITPWDNLIQSYDTEKGSLDLKRVIGIMEGWLLR